MSGSRPITTNSLVPMAKAAAARASRATGMRDAARCEEEAVIREIEG